MELRHLYTFLVLSELNSFTQTAQQLNYAQSSVTAQIQKLEEELGVHLFERLGKSVFLTPEGQQLIPYAQKLTALAQEISQIYAPAGTSGCLRIGAAESLGIYRLPAIIRAFKAAHPQTDLHLDIVDTTAIKTLLTKNAIDIAFTLDIPLVDSSLATTFSIA